MNLKKKKKQNRKNELINWLFWMKTIFQCLGLYGTQMSIKNVVFSKKKNSNFILVYLGTLKTSKYYLVLNFYFILFF